jgi:hypothetical protein
LVKDLAEMESWMGGRGGLKFGARRARRREPSMWGTKSLGVGVLESMDRNRLVSAANFLEQIYRDKSARLETHLGKFGWRRFKM